MKAVVANAVEVTRPLFTRHKHPVEPELCSEPAVVTGDAVRLTQVLANLLTNAAKFTPDDGKVMLALRADGERVEVTVTDTGRGIEKDLLPDIFELFVQGQQGIDRHAGGLGLGLAIVRTLVRMHGGEVVARSEGPGQGACFIVRLPACSETPVGAQGPRPIEVQSQEGGRRILVVDDNVDAALSLAELLRTIGHSVQCAHHARGAVEALRSFDAEVALLDIGLPGVDGYELARQLRSDGRLATVKLIALTGYGRENDREEALRAGFDDHVVKPVALEQLLDAMAKLSSPASP
jgi:CheY-like chemotaxis protein/anti-sigma regulatory factor (Ser/Thr protein kinase)